MVVCAACGAENREGARFCDSCAAPLSAAPATREQRKTVTVLQCDVTGSTALGERLDPESLRAALARYFEAAKAVIERHGGTVEKFIGDAVLAVFGVPIVHEDDALRAVRAAAGIRAEITQLNEELTRDYGTTLILRIGVNTGEVVTGTAERLATGDAVVVAARLEQGAPPGEILLGEETVRLVRGSVEIEELEHVPAKGKAEPLRAHRLVTVSGEAPQRSHEAPFVGREREQRLLAEAWDRTQAEQTAYLFTVLGTAGVGKSRLTAEFLAELPDAHILSGRCLSYGEGITYWPVVEILKQLLGGSPAAVLDEFALDDTASASLLGLLGEAEQPESPEIVAWSFRKLLEAVAEATPLVVVLDDLQWAEPTLLDLVEHVADLSRDAPMLLLCLARPDLLERRPGWGGGKLNTTTALLAPLPADDCERLVDALLQGQALDDAVRTRIVSAADGNPLFVEEMLALIRERGGGGVEVPPSIQALLAARLDQLDPSERSVLERGSVEGNVFHRGAVQALAPEEPEVPTRLVSLVRKELVRPDRTRMPGDDAYRFRHLLIRDATYEALPKSARAELHERFADWLEQHGADLVELDEILGYHLEQAHRYRLELGPTDARAQQLAELAAARLSEAAERADARADFDAVASLLRRVVALSPDDVESARPRLWLARVLLQVGETGEGTAVVDQILRIGRAAGDRPVELLARRELAIDRIWRGTEGAATELEEIAREAIPLFEATGDDDGLVAAWSAVGLVAWERCRYGESLEARQRALRHAQRAGRGQLERQVFADIGQAMFYGPTSAGEALSWFEEHSWLAQARPSQATFQAELLAQLGRFDEARIIADATGERVRELGSRIGPAHVALSRGEIELLASDPTEAERELRYGCELMAELGWLGVVSTYAALWARALWLLHRDDEAMALTVRSEELGASGDVITQVRWRQERARVLARRGEYERARTLAHGAVERIEPTDMLIARGDAFVALADVRELGGDPDGAAAALERALAEYEAKGIVPAVECTKARLAALRAPA